MTDARRCALYRHFDAEGILLYVGISDVLISRTSNHVSSSAWVQFATYVEARWYDSRDEALLAEREAITTERPLFNQQHAHYDKQPTIEYLLRRLSNEPRRPGFDLSHTFTIGFTCVSCGSEDLMFASHDWHGDSVWETWHKLRCQACGYSMWGLTEFGSKGRIRVSIWDTAWAPGPPFGTAKVINTHQLGFPECAAEYAGAS